MLLVLFSIGDTEYCMDAEKVEGVVPSLTVVRDSRYPAIDGYLTYCDQQVPVVDLCWHVLERHCVRDLSTRILIVRHSRHKPFFVGFRAEKMREYMEIEEEKWQSYRVGEQQGIFNAYQVLLNDKYYNFLDTDILLNTIDICYAS